MTELLVDHEHEERHTEPRIHGIGALPWRIGRDKNPEILLISSWRKYDRWTLPKGPPVEGRTAVRSAGLRAFEQAGIIGKASSTALGGYSYAKLSNDDTMQDRHVTLFGLQVKGTLVNWPESKHRKRRWFRLEEAAQMVAEPELAGLLEAFDPKSQELGAP